MKLEQQVTSLELSKRLKKLGVKQESLFHHCPCGCITTKVAGSSHPSHVVGGLETSDLVPYPSAFTAAELGEMLRPHLKKNVWLSEIIDAMRDAENMNDEADARAKMLIYLVENQLISNE